MKKKRVFCLVVLMAAATALFAQDVSFFQYSGNMTAQQFRETFPGADASMRQMGATYISYLPFPVMAAIDNRLSQYTLHIGDVFNAVIYYGGTEFYIALRITNVRDRDSECYSWQRS
jgi:hypothetical protein